jgi:hypothetical protein
LIVSVVEDAETPLAQLTFQWTTNAGTITGSGASATWRIPKGIVAGVDVTATLKVTEAYQALENGVVVAKQHVVSSTSPVFRVHDTEAETRELARKFLVDLFGNSSVPAEACMVDFGVVCAALPEGKTAEFQQIVNHRATVIVYSATLLAQRFDHLSMNFGSVHSAMLYDDQVIGEKPKPPTCGDFEVTVVYDGGRWWICESYYNDDDQSHCPSNTSNAAVARIMRGRGDTVKGR